MRLSTIAAICFVGGMITVLAFKLRIQEVCIPVFVTLNKEKYFVIHEDSLDNTPAGFLVKKTYYIEKPF